MSEITEINIEEIMNQIREEIKEKGYTNDMLSFHDTLVAEDGTASGFDKVQLNQEILTANQIWNNPAYRPLGCGGIKAFFKKAIRKCTKFYVEPIVNDQNTFNAVIVRSLNQISAYMDMNTAISDKIDTLEFKMEHDFKKSQEKSVRTINDAAKNTEKIISENAVLREECKTQSEQIKTMEKQIELLKLSLELVEKKLEKIGG